MKGYTDERTNEDSEKFHEQKRQIPQPPPNKDKD